MDINVAWHTDNARFKLHYGDLTDTSNLTRLIRDIEPDEIYNLGAQSHVAVSFEAPEYTADVDAIGTLRILEAVRFLGLEKKTRFYQASTSELFGLVQEIPQRETTPFYPRSPYAVAKMYAYWIAVNYRESYGMYACNGMPTNLYGPGDDYDLQNSHVLPALLRKFHEAKKNGDEEVIVWGTGSPLREFMHCDDVADALVFLLKEYSAYEPINIGSGIELTIKELAEIIAEVVGFDAKITWDMNMPNGTPRKLMDSSRLRDLGWNNVRPLINGIRSTYAIHFNSQN